jgi:LDH2 family malate/lactate/ureidoglycolate dehydrogenase
MDNAGNVTDDPNSLYSDPPGTVLPLGGGDLGYKGYALALMIEALTSALGGFGRADEPNQWGSCVFLQVIDPGAFGGLQAFRRETGWLADACRRGEPRPDVTEVRVPGDRALELRTEQLTHGLDLYPTILPDLKPWAEKLGVPDPKPLRAS